MLTHTDCVQKPSDIQACAEVDPELQLFFAHLRQPGVIKEFSKHSALYQSCKKSACSSQRIAELDINFNTRWQAEILPENNVTTALLEVG